MNISTNTSEIANLIKAINTLEEYIVGFFVPTGTKELEFVVETTEDTIATVAIGKLLGVCVTYYPLDKGRLYMLTVLSSGEFDTLKQYKSSPLAFNVMIETLTEMV